MDKIYIGIDIGGMSYKGGLVDNDGNIIFKATVPASSKRGNRQFMKDVKILVEELIKEAKKRNLDIEGMGFGIPGVIDSKEGVIKYSNNLKLKNINFVKQLKKYELPIYICNDANTSTLGEARFGAARGLKNVVLLTLGTGVGGGIIVDNKLYTGEAGSGAELGHMVIKTGGRKCTCGRKGCFEAYASATALLRYTREYMVKYKDSKMWEFCSDFDNYIDGSTAFEAYKKYEDLAAKKVIDKYVMYLSEGILNYCNIFRPEMIIIGGGVSNQGDYIIKLINDYCKKYNYGFKSTPAPEIKCAVLKNDAGIIGASLLVKEKIF